MTWASYGQDLEANLWDLHERVQQGRYRASPSRLDLWADWWRKRLT